MLQNERFQSIYFAGCRMYKFSIESTNYYNKVSEQNEKFLLHFCNLQNDKLYIRLSLGRISWRVFKDSSGDAPCHRRGGGLFLFSLIYYPMVRSPADGRGFVVQPGPPSSFNGQASRHSKHITRIDILAACVSSPGFWFSVIKSRASELEAVS